jgi:hypothetical protein
MMGAAMIKAFFAFPYGFEVDYRLTIKRACHDLDVIPVFGDEIRKSKALVDKICEAIEECELGFYDITGFNPNVMIEIGMSYCAERATFIMLNSACHKQSQAVRIEGRDIPSDLEGQHRLEYSAPGELDAELRKTLRQALGIGQNSHHDLKRKIDQRLRSAGAQTLRELAAGIGDPDRDELKIALMALRAEKRVRLDGHGLAARYRRV